MLESLLEKTASHEEPRNKEVCEDVSGDWGEGHVSLLSDSSAEPADHGPATNLFRRSLCR